MGTTNRAQDGEDNDVTASQINRPKVLGNFKNRGPKEKHQNSRWRKERDGMDESHLALIRKLPCCITKGKGGEAHHLKSGTGERGMSVRSTDKWAVPISHNAHMDVENAGTKREREHFLAHGIDPHELARDLWSNRGNLEAMLKVLKAHWDGSTEKQ